MGKVVFGDYCRDFEGPPGKVIYGDYAYDPEPLITDEYLRSAWGNLVIDRPDMTFEEFLDLVRPDRGSQGQEES